MTIDPIKRQPHILHVDDDPDFLEVFRLTFGNFFNITSIDDGAKVPELLEAEKFDLVMTDYDMPDPDGLELLRLIKAKYPDLPVILHTGQGNENVAREAFLAGASDYFTKDIFALAHKEKLINSINTMVEITRARIQKRKSEEKYRHIFENIREVYYESSLDGKIIEVSPSISEISSYTREELLGKSLYSIYKNPKDRDIFLNHMKVTGYHNNFETVMFDKDGREVDVSLNARIVLDDNGKPYKFIGSLRDISQQKSLEKAKTENERQLKRLLNSHVIGVVFTSESGVILEANDAFLEMIGYSRKELEEGKINWKKITPQEYMYQASDLLNQINTMGRSMPLEKQYFRKDGTRVNVLLIISSLMDEPGVFLGIIYELPIGKNTDTVKNQPVHLLEEAFNTLDDTVLIFEEHTGIPIKWNRKFSETTGYSDEEIRQLKAPYDFVEPDEHHKAEQAVSNISENGFGKVKLNLLTKSSEKVPFEYKVSTINSSTGNSRLIYFTGRRLK